MKHVGAKWISLGNKTWLKDPSEEISWQEVYAGVMISEFCFTLHETGTIHFMWFSSAGSKHTLSDEQYELLLGFKAQAQYLHFSNHHTLRMWLLDMLAKKARKEKINNITQ